METREILSHRDVCEEEGVALQRGMNFRTRGRRSVVLVSARAGDSCRAMVAEDGRVVTFEGHDAPRNLTRRDPKSIDQAAFHPDGTRTENGKFLVAAEEARSGARPEPVRVYERVCDGIWAFNGDFSLVDAWKENDGRREVYKFRLERTP
jgi:hypothetical protein